MARLTEPTQGIHQVAAHRVAQVEVIFTAAIYNLVRMRNLQEAPT